MMGGVAVCITLINVNNSWYASKILDAAEYERTVLINACHHCRDVCVMALWLLFYLTPAYIGCSI